MRAHADQSTPGDLDDGLGDPVPNEDGDPSIPPGLEAALADLADWRKADEPAFEETLGGGAPLRLLHVLLICLGVALPNAALVVLFSTIGFGMQVYSFVAEPMYSLIGDACLSGSFLVIAILFVCDWRRCRLCLRIITFAFPFCIFAAGSAFKGRKYPWAPVLMTLLLMPVALGCIRLGVCRDVRQKSFYAAVSAVTLFIGVGMAVLWTEYILWGSFFLDLSGRHEWNQETKNEIVASTKAVYDNVYEHRPLVYSSDCGPDKMVDHLDKASKAAIEIACSEASTLGYIAWVCPFIAIGCDVVVSCFCLLTGTLVQVGDISNVQRVITRFATLVCFILCGMYACSAISATSIRMGSTLLAFFMASLVLSLIWVLAEVDHRVVHESKFLQQLVQVWKSDWSKALFVGAAGIPMLMFLWLDWWTQKFRKCRGAEDPAGRRGDRFTPFGRMVVSVVRQWNWTSVCLKICLLGELFFTLQIGVMKVTYIFLSWLNTLLADVSLSFVILLVYVIGSIMFLLPPVPGLPVYVFAGILIASAGRRTEAVGFWWGCIIAMAVGLFTKLCACVGQYMIGYYAGKSIKVQQLIGVDQVPTRAIERILKSKGLNAGKVAILVGGPDWPTSVTCGIIKCNIPQMLLGTLPVFVLMAPCVLAGAFLARVSPGEDSTWSMAASAATAVSALVNMASMAYAITTIGSTIQNHGDELAKPRPEHAAVAELTRSEQAMVDIYNKTVAWSSLGCFWQMVLSLATVLMLLSNGVMVCMAEACFRPFAVSSKIKDNFEDDGLEGDVFNIVLSPSGWVALGVFALAAILHWWFEKVMSRKAKRASPNDYGVLDRSCEDGPNVAVTRPGLRFMP